jgi:hypothetical protein
MTNNPRKFSRPPRQMLSLVLLFLVACGLEGCGGWFIEFSTPDVPPAPCPIQELLLDVSNFPNEDWQETGSRSERSAPVRMGIEKIGTSFSDPNDGTLQQAYRFESEQQARSAYREEVESWFTPAEHEMEWATPQEMENLAVNADQYRVGCNDLKSGGREQCQYVAQYGPYILLLFGGMRSLSYDDFIGLVNEVDQRATNCLK